VREAKAVSARLERIGRRVLVIVALLTTFVFFIGPITSIPIPLDIDYVGIIYLIFLAICGYIGYSRAQTRWLGFLWICLLGSSLLMAGAETFTHLAPQTTTMLAPFETALSYLTAMLAVSAFMIYAWMKRRETAHR
jgi:hypothetical protein